jgi:hypothetical protein
MNTQEEEAASRTRESTLMRKLLLGFLLVAVLAIAAYLRFHHPKPPLARAYAGNRQVTVWNTTAQVRAPVGTVNYGDPLVVLEQFDDQVKVRTRSGVIGWASEDDLLSEDLWHKARELDVRTAALPAQARGHTRSLSNLHVEPGRTAARIRQLNSNVPVDLFERRAVAVSPSASTAEGDTEQAAGNREEDWWLIRAHLPDDSTVSGWLLGRFLALDVPAPLPDYASSAGMHIVAWFELNHVLDASGNAKPQYLVVGARGGEGQPCDFTLMRAYTWAKKRARYETAFVESDVCGKLPVQLKQANAQNGGVSFAFLNSGGGTESKRTYRMADTIIREVRPSGSKAAGRKHARG